MYRGGIEKGHGSVGIRSSKKKDQEDGRRNINRTDVISARPASLQSLSLSGIGCLVCLVYDRLRLGGSVRFFYFFNGLWSTSGLLLLLVLLVLLSVNWRSSMPPRAPGSGIQPCQYPASYQAFKPAHYPCLGLSHWPSPSMTSILCGPFRLPRSLACFQPPPSFSSSSSFSSSFSSSSFLY